MDTDYHKCHTCGKWLILEASMSVVFRFMTEIDYSYLNLYMLHNHTGLPFRRINRKNHYDYHNLRESSHRLLLGQSVMITREIHNILIF